MITSVLVTRACLAFVSEITSAGGRPGSDTREGGRGRGRLCVGGGRGENEESGLLGKITAAAMTIQNNNNGNRKGQNSI